MAPLYVLKGGLPEHNISLLYASALFVDASTVEQKSARTPTYTAVKQGCSSTAEEPIPPRFANVPKSAPSKAVRQGDGTVMPTA
jgi:hypothetical protein